jgi:GR25 family glycosyltransferase involved in LPS biosynthesis
MSISIPKIFCLTLKRTPLRKEYAQNHFISHGIDNVTFFDGIDGDRFGLRTVIPYKDDNPTGPDYFIKQGRIGCILSHYMLWTTLSYLPYDEIIIFEDDAVLCDGFIGKFLEYKQNLPYNWEYVFIGHCCLPPPSMQFPIAKNIITCSHPPMCTHAYMIKKSAIPMLLDTNAQAWAAVDIQIQKRSLKYLKHYVFLPPLVDQISTLKQLNPLDTTIDPQDIFKSLTLDSSYT